MENTYIISKNRYLDSNNFLNIKNQCVMRSGIFEYVAHEIKDLLNDDSINDNEIIKVYRPADELEKIKDSFVNKPITLEHSWVSVLENNKNIVGNIGSNITFDKDKGEIIADLLTIYNAEAINEIQNNMRDKLSAGFKHELIKQEGEYDGVKYSYIQIVKDVNHLALCENPRDSNLQIHDSKNANTKFNLIQGAKQMSFKLIDLINSFNQKGKKIQDSVTQDDLESLKKDDASSDNGDEPKKVVDSDSEPKTQDNTDEPQKAQDSDNDTDKFAEILKAIEALNERINTLENKQDVAKDSDEPKTQDEPTEPTITKEDVEKEVAQKVAQAIAERDKEEAEFMEAYDSVSKIIGAFMPYNADNKRKSANEIYAYGLKALGERNGLNFGKVQDSKTAFLIANQTIESNKSKAQDSKPFVSDVKDSYELPNRFNV